MGNSFVLPTPPAQQKSTEAGVMTKQEWYARLASCPLFCVLDNVLHHGTTVARMRQRVARTP